MAFNRRPDRGKLDLIVFADGFGSKIARQTGPAARAIEILAQGGCDPYVPAWRRRASPCPDAPCDRLSSPRQYGLRRLDYGQVAQTLGVKFY